MMLTDYRIGELDYTQVNINWNADGSILRLCGEVCIERFVNAPKPVQLRRVALEFLKQKDTSGRQFVLDVVAGKVLLSVPFLAPGKVAEVVLYFVELWEECINKAKNYLALMDAAGTIVNLGLAGGGINE